MSCLWGFADVVLEGESAREETGYCSEIIVAGEVQYRFGYAMKHEYKYLDEDNEFSPRVLVGKYPIFEGNIKYEYDGTILKICESTYAGEGTILPFLIALLGEDTPDLKKSWI